VTSGFLIAKSEMNIDAYPKGVADPMITS
jgi:hypothetical protein